MIIVEHSKEEILNHIHSTSDKVADHFDKFHSAFVESMASDISVSFKELDSIINHPTHDLNDQEFQSALLLWSCLNSAICAIEAFRRGYFIEPSAICRNTLEYACAAYEICKDVSAHTKYMSGKYHSNEAPTFAKKQLAMIGKVYGILSNLYTHLSPLHSVPQGATNDKGSTSNLWIGGGFSEQDKRKHHMVRMSISLLVDIIGAITELCFYELVVEKRYISKNSDSILEWSPNERIVGREAALAAEMGKDFGFKE
jgi:hypothetical protein